uniref:Uncharacterized protein n=1 Tax=Cacopsylla melanoneura TaxID=428564 RepID=A0A8D8TRH9_9HEMI
MRQFGNTEATTFKIRTVEMGYGVNCNKVIFTQKGIIYWLNTSHTYILSTLIRNTQKLNFKHASVKKKKIYVKQAQVKINKYLRAFFLNIRPKRTLGHIIKRHLKLSSA